MPSTFHRYPDPPTLAQDSAKWLAARIAEAIAVRGRCTVALSGGSTPGATYQQLALLNIDWARVHLFWGDERCVGPAHEHSCYRMARETLIDHIAIPSKNVHRIKGELPPSEAATDYERKLRALFGAEMWPRFDIVLLGLGNDGHTASLFPHTPALNETIYWAVSVEHRTPPLPLVDRVTLTAPAINAATHIAFFVTGASKAERLREVIHGPHQPDVLPAQLIRPTNGELVWMVDEAAGTLLV